MIWRTALDNRLKQLRASQNSDGRRGQAKGLETAADNSPSTEDEWVDRQIADLRELVQEEHAARSQTASPLEERPAQDHRARRSLPGGAARTLASPLVALRLLLARAFSFPFRVASAAGGILRAGGSQMGWTAIAVGFGAAVGVGITLLLR